MAKKLLRNLFEEIEQSIKVGDKVKYSSKFLKSAGIYTGDVPFAEGEVVEIKKLGDSNLAKIKWNYPDIPERVNVKNLILVSKVHLEPA